MSGVMTERTTEFREWTETIGRRQMQARSYKLGDEYVCIVDNIRPGAPLTRVAAATREEAEAKATEQAKRMLDDTSTAEE